MRGVAVNLAGLSFFVFALAGYLADQPPLTCALRALGGAGAFYVVLRVAGRVAMSVLVDAVARSQGQADTARRGEDRDV